MKINFKVAGLILFFGLLIGDTFGQANKNEYVKFNRNGIEYQTNGIDTICIVDPMPQFPGGQSKMIDFISNNIRYPRKAMRNQVEGQVTLRFVVDKAGLIQDIVVINSVRDDLDKEAIRVIKKMPKWEPGKQNGNPIPVQFTLSIMFQL